MDDPKKRLSKFIEEEADDLKRILRSYVVRMGLAPPGNADETTEEILSQVVVIALTQSDRFDTTRRPMPWLLGIGLNIMRSQQRQFYEAREVTVHDDTIFEQLADQTTFVDAVAYESWLNDVLSSLSVADQQIIRLAILHDLDSNTVGHMLRLAPGTVRVRLHRALKRLRRWMKLEALDE